MQWKLHVDVKFYWLYNLTTELNAGERLRDDSVRLICITVTLHVACCHVFVFAHFISSATICSCMVPLHINWCVISYSLCIRTFPSFLPSSRELWPSWDTFPLSSSSTAGYNPPTNARGLRHREHGKTLQVWPKKTMFPGLSEQPTLYGACDTSHHRPLHLPILRH